MALVRIDSLHFHYPSPFHSIFEDLDLEFDTDWRTGLVGRNGRGKTTLLKLLHGELQGSRGSVCVPVATTRFPFEPESKEGSVHEVVKACVAPFQSMEAEMEAALSQGDAASLELYSELQEDFEKAGGYTIESRVERELASLGLDGDVAGRDYTTLSAGEQTRAMIAALFLKESRFPLIDEPTNHLDMAGRELLGQYLASKSGYLLVSHDRHFLDLSCEHIISINKSDVRIENGNFSSWREQLELRESSERKRQAGLAREIKGLEASALRRRG